MSHEIWIAAAVSIPISLTTGLLVRPIHNWLDAKGKTHAQRKMERLKLQYWRVLYFLGNPAEFQDWLLNAILRGLAGVAYMTQGGFMAIAILVSIVQSHLLHPNAHLNISDKASSIVGTIVGMAGSFMGGFYLSALIEAVRLYKVVRFPTRFLDTLPESVRNRDMEKQAFARRDYWSPSSPELAEVATKTKDF